MTSYAFENLFRTPWEFMVSAVSLGFGVVCLTDHTALGLDVHMGPLVAIPFFALAGTRAWQGFRIRHFRQRLLVLKPFALSIPEIPASRQHMYLGRGFKWLPVHRQRMSLLSQLQNQAFMQKNALYRYIQARARENPDGISATLTEIKWLPFKPNPDIGGKPWIHGVGSDAERPVYINQANRNSHECVFGMTRVGKTRYMAIKVIQDIKNAEAVLVIDPKGDLDVLKDIFCAAAACGRLGDLKILHLGFPELSAKYNPLASVSNVSEVAGRITGAMSASGEGKQFKDFAWTYLNIVAQCLHELGEPINYKTMGFYIKRPEILMLEYVDRIFPKVESGYMSDVQSIIDEHDSRVDKEGNPVLPMKRSMAIKRYLTAYIEGQAASGSSKQLMDSIVVPLYNAAMLDKTYYDKITASVGPVLDKINQTQAHEVFSWDNAFGLPEIRLEDVIKRKQIVYIGLDSLTNREMAEAVGQSIIADLVSLCGRLYSTSSGSVNILNLYCDEFSNIVRDEFVGLLNKAGGAGIRVTALTQTVNDLGAALGGSGDKAKMLLGNFGTMTMLRVSNEDTAQTLSRCLETIKTRSTTPSTSTSDRAEPVGGELFGTANTDIVTESNNPLVEVNDLFSLPKGQAFVLTNGGEVYKIRIPLSKNDGSAPETFEAILSEVNLCF